MEFFSINAVLLGALFGTSIYFSNILFSLLCIFYNIKIIEFSVFQSPKFSLHKESIAGTNFTLGWLPLGTYIKPLGMTTDEEEKSKICESELPYAFFNKPQYLRTIFSLVPWFIYFIAFTIAFIWFSNFTNLLSEIKSVINYLIEAFSSMFSEEVARKKFIKTTAKISTGKNTVAFAFMLLCFAMLFFTPLGEVINWLSNDKKNKSIFEKVIKYFILIAFLWLIIWKIPLFVFSFFTFSESIIYIPSFIIGIFFSGLTLFFTTLFVVKNISLSINTYRNKWW